MKNKKILKNVNWFTVSTFIFLVIYSILTVVLLGWGILTAFKDKWDLADNVFGLPKKWMFSNFSDVMGRLTVPITKTNIIMFNGIPRKLSQIYNVGFFEMFYNSLVYTLFGSFIASIGPVVMGYAIGKFDYKFNKFLTGYIVFSMSFTLVGGGPASIDFRKFLGLYDNMWGESLLTFGWCSINTLMYAGIFGGVSKEYHEAAWLDGANELTIMLRIMLPFALNLYGTFFVIRIIGAWNTYGEVLMYVPSHPTISYATYLMSVSKDASLADTPHRIATAVLMLVPTTAVFVVFRNKFI
ncbi:MAG: carbohydrate ABC transporter permease, partial [Clostridia bacterium]|nr:carbohydrate ABC transporter permease [Clostridia bacterium]